MLGDAGVLLCPNRTIVMTLSPSLNFVTSAPHLTTSPGISEAGRMYTNCIESFDRVYSAEKFRVFVIGGVEAYVQTFEKEFVGARRIISFDVFYCLGCVGVYPQGFMRHFEFGRLELLGMLERGW